MNIYRIVGTIQLLHNPKLLLSQGTLYAIFERHFMNSIKLKINKTKMKNLFIIISTLILFSCSNNISKNRNLVSIDSNQFEFELPKESKELNNDFKEVMLEVNNKILYLALCDTNNSKYLFMVSKYIAPNKMTIDAAFNQSVNTTTNLDSDSLTDNFQLIDYKTYEVHGKTIRYKISMHFDRIYTIMYYFMKDDYSTELYEIKTSASKNDLSKALKFIEKVALSVRIK
jgi:hypothetical protein